MRMRAAFSTTRAPILSRRSLRVANSARASGVAQGEHQPIGAGVQDQPELIGEGALAGGPVRGELPLVQLDQVLGLASGAVDIFVEMAGLAGERGDDVAGVEAGWGARDAVGER